MTFSFLWWLSIVKAPNVEKKKQQQQQQQRDLRT